MSRLLLLFSWDWGQVDITLHRRQRFNLASRPASLSLPQAAWRANTEPAIATSFANDLFVVVDVGHASHCDHTGLQHLWVGFKRTTFSSGHLWRNDNYWSTEPHLNLLLRRKLNNCCSVYFTEQNTTCACKSRQFTLHQLPSKPEQNVFLWIITKKCTYPITCSTNVLWSLPWLYLQVVHQRAHGKSSQRVRVTFIGWDCRVQ